MVQHYLDKKVLRRVSKAPEFSYPTYLVYSRERDSPPPAAGNHTAPRGRGPGHRLVPALGPNDLSKGCCAAIAPKG